MIVELNQRVVTNKEVFKLIQKPKMCFSQENLQHCNWNIESDFMIFFFIWDMRILSQKLTPMSWVMLVLTLIQESCNPKCFWELSWKGDFIFYIGFDILWLTQWNYPSSYSLHHRQRQDINIRLHFDDITSSKVFYYNALLHDVADKLHQGVVKYSEFHIFS